MTKILFLDMDGVMLSREDLTRTLDHRAIPESKIRMLNEIVERTGAAVVVSSVWRMDQDIFTHARLTLAGYCGTFGAGWKTDTKGPTRGHEIERWLNFWRAHEEVETYAIVDDDSDMLPAQMPHFVKTDNETGLQTLHVEKLVAILNGLSAA